MNVKFGNSYIWVICVLFQRNALVTVLHRLNKNDYFINIDHICCVVWFCDNPINVAIIIILLSHPWPKTLGWSQVV